MASLGCARAHAHGGRLASARNLQELRGHCKAKVAPSVHSWWPPPSLFSPQGRRRRGGVEGEEECGQNRQVQAGVSLGGGDMGLRLRGTKARAAHPRSSWAPVGGASYRAGQSGWQLGCSTRTQSGSSPLLSPQAPWHSTAGSTAGDLKGWCGMGTPLVCQHEARARARGGAPRGTRRRARRRGLWQRRTAARMSARRGRETNGHALPEMGRREGYGIVENSAVQS